MADYIKEHYGIYPSGSVVSLPISQKKALLNELKSNVGATTYEACKFLHLDMGQQVKA